MNLQRNITLTMAALSGIAFAQGGICILLGTLLYIAAYILRQHE